MQTLRINLLLNLYMWSSICASNPQSLHAKHFAKNQDENIKPGRSKHIEGRHRMLYFNILEQRNIAQRCAPILDSFAVLMRICALYSGSVANLTNIWYVSCRHSILLHLSRRLDKLDPVGSTARYEMMKLCTGSVQDTMRRQQSLIDVTGSVQGIHAFIYCTKWRTGQVLLMPYSLTTPIQKRKKWYKVQSQNLIKPRQHSYPQ